MVENVSVVIIEETANDKNQYGNVADLEEINETDNFGKLATFPFR